MPYYRQRRALCPVSDDTLTARRIDQLISDIGTVYGEIPGGFFRTRSKAVEDYKGFYVARSLSFNRPGTGSRCYTLCLIGEELDGRVSIMQDDSPWTRDGIPTEADIEAYWQPLQSPADLVDIHVLFGEILQKIAQKQQRPTETTVEKIKALREESVDPGAISDYCKILGGDTPETQAHIENHVLPAAQDPAGYLTKMGLIEKMSVSGCRNFTWRDAILFGYFRRAGFLAELDWKAEPEDITAALQKMLGLHHAEITAPILSEDLSAEGALARATQILSDAGWDLFLLGDEGDSYILTLAEQKNTREFLRLGRTIGLKTLQLQLKKRTTLIERLFGRN